MKFAKSLLRNEVPEWSQSYIDYKSLKKLVNQVAETAKRAPDGANVAPLDDQLTAPFFYAVDRNVEVVDSFYNSKFTEYGRRLRRVEQQWSEVWQQLARHESEDADKHEIVGLLVELRTQLRSLQWYAEVNKQGFQKILKKFDKKVGTHAQSQYMASKINILGFCHGQELQERIAAVGALLQELAPDVAAAARGASPPQLPGGAQISSSTATSTADPAADPLDALKLAIDSNDAAGVRAIVDAAPLTARQTVTFLARAVAVGASATLGALVSSCESSGALALGDAVNGRNVLHRVIISAGRRAEPTSAASVAEKEDAGAHVLTLIGVLPDLKTLALAVDHQLRAPVHYAARYGLARVVEALLVAAPVLFPDSDGLMPADLAVLHNHPRTLDTILQFASAGHAVGGAAAGAASAAGMGSARLLLTAAKLDSAEICDVLVRRGHFDVNYRDPKRGETALHVAAKHNHLATVERLIALGADLEVRENLYGWTPLFLAAVDGLDAVCSVLLAAGARADTLDNSGWSPREHAALRGHLKLADKLPASTPPAAAAAAAADDDPSVSKKAGALLDRRRSNDRECLKTFGHRYLEGPDEKLVLVTLGSRDLRMRSVGPVQLDVAPVSESGHTELDTALTLIVRAEGSKSEPHRIDLPVPELGLATEPIPFFSADLDSFNLVFDLVPTYHAGDRPIARGVYTFPKLTNKMQDLNLSAQSVLMVEAATLRILGRVNFELLIVKPFAHPNNTVNATSTYWRSLATTRVIGHRGLGKNTLANSSLQLGENTVESFIQAANLGAGYVEFDVQLTKDEVPVIYHDFLVGDSGFDIPMHAMTFDQFMNIHAPARGRTDSIVPRPDASAATAATAAAASSDVPLPGMPGDVDDSSAVAADTGDGAATATAATAATATAATAATAEPPAGADSAGDSLRRPPLLKKRSHSVAQFNHTHELDNNYDAAYRRMRYTRDFKLKGYKGNVRGLHIQSKFATLAELFDTLPQDLGFNIEFKYPMLDEAEAEEMDGNVFEINRFVDTILKTIFDHKKERDIILSSFNPDVCILLSLKQPSLPVLFLTEGGTAPMMDVRASSLQEAVRFAKRFNLLGIVSEALPLIMCPRLVRAVKENGLVCFTYGTENNVPENARVQLKAGVDAVIVDSVLAIREELTDITSEQT